jgi:hypothetical protein
MCRPSRAYGSHGEHREILAGTPYHQGASSVRKGLTVVLAQWDVGCRVAGLPADAGPAELPRKEDGMTVSEQIDALQAKVADLKRSLDASRHETNEQIKARVASAKAKADAARDTVHGQAEQAADHAHSQWQSFKADASAKMQELQGRIDRQRDQRDVKAAESDAEWAEDNASDALDYAAWALDQAEVAVLDAADARAWADARAAASPPS